MHVLRISTRNGRAEKQCLGENIRLMNELMKSYQQNHHFNANLSTSTSLQSRLHLLRLRMPLHPLRRERNIQLELLRRLSSGALVLAHACGNALAFGDGLEVDDQVVLDGEDGVGRQPRVVLGVDLRNDGFVAFVGDLSHT